MENITAVWLVSIAIVYLMIYNKGYKLIGATLFMIIGLLAVYISNSAVSMGFSLITIIILGEAIINNTVFFPNNGRY